MGQFEEQFAKRSEGVQAKISEWQATGELHKLDTPEPYKWEKQEQMPLTYADPVPEATSQKNWERLTPFEQKAAMWLPKAIGDASQLMTGWMSDDLKENLSVAWGPIGKIVAPVASTLGKALMLFALPAEGVERAWGLAQQYKDAAYDGTTDEFMANLDSAWKAAHFKYETEGVAVPWVSTDDKGNLTVEFPLMGDMPGVEAQVKARQMFMAGATQEQVAEAMSQDMGALAFRGMLNDVIMQSILDPMWLLGGLPGMAGRYRHGLLLGRSGYTVAEATDKLSDARRVVEGLESAAKVAEDLGDVSQTIGRLRTQVSIEGLAGQILEEGVELSGDVIKGLSVADRSKLVEQGILVFNDATGRFTYTKKGIEIAEQVAKASDPALAAQINTAREALEKAEYGLRFAQEKALTPLQHKFLQLTGGIPGATDMERSSLALQKGKLLKPWTWFRMTPEAKAQEVINMVGNHMAALIGNADTPEAAAAILRNASSAMATQEMGKLILSVEGRAFTAMINGSDAVATNMIRGWKASEAQRWMLTNVAEFLGKSVDDLVADMAEKDGPGRVMRAITAIVDAPIAKGTSVDAMQTMLKSGLNEDALKKLADFFVDGKIPFSKDTFKLHMIGEVAEIARRNAVAVFGVQTEGMFTKATNALKAAETLAYLRLNPGYPIRNFLNNEVTMFARGVWNSMSANDIERLWAHVGWEPGRLGSGIGMAGEKAAEAASRAKIQVSKAIREAEEAVAKAAKGDRNWMDRVAGGINQINLGKLDGGYWASTMESFASRRALTGGFMQGMDWYMKKSGQIIRFEDYMAKYHPEVDISGLDSEVLGAIWRRTQGMLGEKDVELLFQSQMRAGWDDILDDVAKSMGMPQDELRNRIGDEMLTRLKFDVTEAIEMRDPERLTRAFDNIHEQLQEHLSGLAVNDFETYAERTAARIQAVGDPTAYLRIYGEGIDAHFAGWEGYLNRLSERARDIRALPQEKQGAAWDHLMTDGEGYFGRLFQRDEARLEGMMRAARSNGIHVPEDAIKPFRNLRDATAKFHQDRRRLYRAFREEAPKLNPEKREEMFLRLQDDLDQSYARLMQTTQDSARDLDNVLLDAIRANAPEAHQEISAWRATVRDLRQQYMVDVQVHYRSIRGLKDEARAAAQDAFNARRLQWQNRIHMAEREGLTCLENGQAFGTAHGIDAETLGIYSKHMGAAPDTLFFEGLGETVAERTQKYVQAGYSPKMARMMAAGDVRSATGLTAGRVEARLGGSRAWVDAGRVTRSQQTIDASVALRKLEEIGTPITGGHVQNIAKSIEHPPERIQWLDNLVAETSDIELRRSASKVLSDEWSHLDKDAFLGDESPLFNSRWAAMSAERGTPNRMATKALEKDIRDLGYEPIPVKGTYTEGGVVRQEASFMVPGMSDREAYKLGQKYGQESVLVRGGFVKTRGEGFGFCPTNGVKEITDPDAYASVMDIGGRPLRFSMTGGKMDPNGNLVFDQPWRASMDEPNGFITVERWMNKPGYKVIDPGDANQRSGVAFSGSKGHGFPPVHGYYLSGTPPESLVTQGRHLYRASVPSDKIYDLLRDPEGVVQALRKTQDASGINVGAPILFDDIATELNRRGYWGLRRGDIPEMPNTIQIWKPLEPLGSDQIGKRASMIMQNMGGQPINSQTVRDAVKTTFNLTDNEADLVQAVMDGRSKFWGRRTGRDAGEWYTTHIADVRWGLPDGYTGREYGELGQRFTSSELADVLDQTGILPEAYMAQILGSAREMPEYIGHVSEYMATMRQRAIEGGFTRRDVTKAYLMTVGSYRATAKPVTKIAEAFEKAGLQWPPNLPVPLERFFNLDEAGQVVIRPEGFTAMWLMTESGQAALNSIDNGLYRAELFDEMIQWRKAARWGMDPWSKNGVFHARGGEYSLGNLDEFLDVFNNKVRQVGADGKVTFDLDLMGAETMKLRGIGTGKEGFMRHFLGFGDSPTVDVNALRAWLDGSPIDDVYGKKVIDWMAQNLPQRPKAYSEMKAAITERMNGLRQAGYLKDVPDDQFYTLMHHQIWDKILGLQTSHAGEGLLMTAFESGDLTNIVNRAAATFLGDGRAVISALEKPDLASAIHEIGHVIRFDIARTQPELVQKLEKYMGIKNGVWDRSHEEWFARAFESYIKRGIAPTEELRPFFERGRAWMEQIYDSISWKREHEPLLGGREGTGIFDEIFAGDLPANGLDGSLKPGIGDVRFDEMIREEPSIGQPLDELWWNDGGEILGRMRTSAMDAMNKPAMAGIPTDTPEMLGAVSGYRSYMRGAMKDANAFAVKYGTMKRDAALLNYKARTYFDQGLANAMPFGFWTTHSAWKWALWSLERPGVISEFMRIKNFTSDSGLNTNLPQRLKGSVPFTNLPFLPKWLGPLFVNPTRAVNLPFDMWMSPIEQGSMAGAQIIKQAERQLQVAIENGDVPEDQAMEAIRLHQGPIWEDAISKAKSENPDSYDPFDAMSTLMAPHAPIMWAYHAARGTTDEIGPFLPVTRSIKGITALMGVPGGVNIEGWVRDKLGLPVFDKWDEYRTERMLVNMAASQQISVDDAQAAWVTKEGPIWEEAKRRAGIEFGIGAVSNLAGFPAKAYPEGEQFSRLLTSELSEAYDKGTEKAFFEAHPEVRLRLALFDTPEQRFKTFMVDALWDTYNNLPGLSKSTARDILGTEFEEFLSGGIKADGLDTDKAAVWLKTMGFSNPAYTADAKAAVGEKTLADGTTRPLAMPPPQIAQQAQSYYDLRQQKFSPLIFEYQNEYFKLQEGAERRQYLAKHPGLKAYWDWRTEWLLRHPEAAPYITEEPPKMTNAQAAQAEGRPVNLSREEWQQLLGGHVFALVEDTKRGHELPEPVSTLIERKAEEYGLEYTVDEVVQLILTSPGQ